MELGTATDNSAFDPQAPDAGRARRAKLGGRKVAEPEEASRLGPMVELQMKCLCGSTRWDYDKVTAFFVCAGCKRCSGRGRNGLFSHWPIATCYKCGVTDNMEGVSAKKYWCKSCGEWQYDQHGPISGNKLTEEKASMDSMFGFD